MKQIKMLHLCQAHMCFTIKCDELDIIRQILNDTVSNQTDCEKLVVLQLLQDMSEEEITHKKRRDVVGEILDPTTFAASPFTCAILDYFSSEKKWGKIEQTCF